MKKIKFPVTIGYGMTECGPLISMHAGLSTALLPPEHLSNTLQSKSVLPILQNTGEILIHGDQVFNGYYKNEDATREVLIDGWLHTGDIGTIDKDNFIYIKGRSKT